MSIDLEEVEVFPSTHYSPTLREFLRFFAEEVESLSVHGGDIWENIVKVQEIYVPQPTYWNDIIEWEDRRKVGEQRFHIQCAVLCREGVFSPVDLGDKWYSPDRPEWRKGENQTAEAILGCNGDKFLISALFIYALLSSGTRSETYAKTLHFDEKTSHASRRTSARMEPPLYGLKRLLADYLARSHVWHYWASTCTSLVPIVADRSIGNHVFSWYGEFVEFLAGEFVITTSKLCVCRYRFVDHQDQLLMRQIAKFVESNKKRAREQQRIADEQRLLYKAEEERLKNERNKREQDLLVEYEGLCKEVLVYTDAVPQIFLDHAPLSKYWRKMDRRTLERLIWSAPLTLIAKMFGKSDNGIRKWAREYNIKLPKAGYWAKVRAGKVVYPQGRPDSE